MSSFSGKYAALFHGQRARLQALTASHYCSLLQLCYCTGVGVRLAFTHLLRYRQQHSLNSCRLDVVVCSRSKSNANDGHVKSENFSFDRTSPCTTKQATKKKNIGGRRAIQHSFFTIPTYMAFTTALDKLMVVAKIV